MRLEGKFSNKHDVRRLQTRFWIALIKSELEAHSAYEISRIMSPEKIKHSDDGTRWDNKWRRYEKGTQTPKAKTLALAASKVPSSDYYFYQPLWKLITKHISDKEYIGFCNNLPNEYKKIVEQCTGNNKVSLFEEKKLLNKLSIDGGVFALNAALLILYHAETHSQDRFYNQRSFCVYDTLINVCIQERFREFFHPLYKSIRARFFREKSTLMSDVKSLSVPTVEHTALQLFDFKVRLISALHKRKHLKSESKSTHLFLFFFNRLKEREMNSLTGYALHGKNTSVAQKVLRKIMHQVRTNS